MLTSKEEISKIEETYLKKHRQVFLVPYKPSLTKASSFPILICLSKTHCQMPGGRPGVC